MCMRARYKPSKYETQCATEFNELYEEISKYAKADTHGLAPQRTTELCKKINRYCQLAVRAERQYSDQFDFFCYNKSLDMLYNLFLRSQSKEVLTCIIQVVSMMLVNFSRSDSVHWFLSSAAISNLLQVRFPSLDCELAEYYINMLKSLSSKVDAQTVHLFYNEVRSKLSYKIPTFPLLWQAIRFFNHPEALVRNTSRNVVLSICGIKEEGVQRYVGSFPFVIYYSHLASHLRDCWLAIGALLYSKLTSDEKLDKLGLLVEDHYDLLLYLDDLMDVLTEPAKTHLTNCLIRQCFIPLIRDFQHCQLKLPPKITLFILSVAFRSLNRMPTVLNVIVVVLFGRYVPRELTLYMLAAENQKPLASYSRNWIFGNFWDKHFDIVNKNCRNLFVKNSKEPRARSVSDREGESPRRLTQSTLPPLNNMLSSHVLFGEYLMPSEIDREAAKIYQLFRLKIIGGSAARQPNSSIFELLEGMQKDLLESSFIDLDELDDSKNVAAVISCLNVQREVMYSDDESAVANCIEMISQLLKAPSQTKEILKFSGLFLSEQVGNLPNSYNLRRVVLQLVEMLKQRSGSFSVETYVAASDLIKFIVKGNSTGLFDGFAALTLNETVRTVADRLAAYACNYKDYAHLLRLYYMAHYSLKTIVNRQEVLMRLLVNPEEQHVTDLQSQIVKDFAVYLLLAEMKASYVEGSPSLAELTSTRSFDVTASSMLGKEIEFPYSQVTPGEYKETEAGLNFKCFLLINKIGFMLSEKTGSHRGRVILNCGFERLACELRETELKRLYFTYSEKGRRPRNFYVHFDSNKTAHNVKRDFDGYRHYYAKYMVGNLMKALTKCANPPPVSALKKPPSIPKRSSLNLIPMPFEYKSTEAQSTNREPIPPLTESLMDMF